MSTLDLTPHPGAARPASRIWRHALVESRLTLRNGEQLLLSLVIPVAVLVAGRVTGDRFGLSFATVAPGVLAMVIWSSAFTSPAISTGFERRYGVLERLAATPLARSGILAGKAVSIGMITSGQVALLGVSALLLGWRPQPTGIGVLLAVVGTALAMLAFAGLALALAGVASAEVTLALANLVYLAGLAVGGILLPGAQWTPTGALGSLLRASAQGGQVVVPVLVLAVWAVAGGLLAGKVFRWIS